MNISIVRKSFLMNKLVAYAEIDDYWHYLRRCNNDLMLITPSAFLKSCVEHWTLYNFMLWGMDSHFKWQCFFSWCTANELVNTFDEQFCTMWGLCSHPMQGTASNCKPAFTLPIEDGARETYYVYTRIVRVISAALKVCANIKPKCHRSCKEVLQKLKCPHPNGIWVSCSVLYVT